MPDIESLSRKLRSAEAEERREAAIELGAAGQEALPLLFHALGDKDWRVRKTAVDALVERADFAVVRGLLAALSAHDNAGARNSAIEALVRIGPDAVDALLEALPTPDPDVRKFVVDILGDIRDLHSVPALIGTLSDPDENIRVASAEALGKIKDARAVDALIGCLTRRDDSWIDYAAAEALGEIGDERALGPLLAALARTSLREPVFEALGKIGNVNTLGPLIKGLADATRIVREVSTNALAAIWRKSSPPDRAAIVKAVREGANEQAVESLEEMIATGAGDLRKAAVGVLGWAGRERSIGKLLTLLKEEEMEEPMVQAIRNIGGSCGVLIGFLKDDNALVRRTVARVLGDQPSQAAGEALIGLLSDENGHVRSAAAESLGRLDSKHAVGPLLGLMTDEYESVQASAIGALAEIGDESVLDRLTGDFSSKDAALRKNIVLLLGKFSSEKASDALAFAMKDPEPEVRKAAVRALSGVKLIGTRASRALVLAVTDDDPEVRMLAAEALGESPQPQAARALTPLLQDPDLWVRAAAARSLGKRGGQEAVEALTEHLLSATDIFLLALIDVLGPMKAEGALAPLLKLATHTDPEVRKSVLNSLAHYPWDRVRAAVLDRLSDEHWSVRKTAIEIVRQNRDNGAETALMSMAELDPDGSVRQAAKEALGR